MQCFPLRISRVVCQGSDLETCNWIKKSASEIGDVAWSRKEVHLVRQWLVGGSTIPVKRLISDKSVTVCVNVNSASG